MNVVVVSSGNNLFDRGEGDKERVYNIIRQLEHQNHNVITIQPNVEKDENVVSYKKLTPPMINDLNPYLYKKLLKVSKEQPVDIYHVKEPSGVVASKIASRATSNGTVIYDAHNIESRRLKSEVVNDLSNIKSSLAPIIVPKIELAAVHAADHIITVSDIEADAFVNDYDIDASKISVVPSGVSIPPSYSPDEFDLDQYGIDDNRFKIVFHGSHSYRPNLKASKFISEKLSKEISDENCKFIIAGKNTPDFDQSNVHSVGFVDDLYQFLNAMDAAIVPLTNGGGTKLKMLDYLGTGLPIVTTDVGAEGLAIEDGRHALIRDLDGFTVALEKVQTNKELQKRLKQNSKQLAEKYTWESIGGKVNQIYTDLSLGY